MSIVASELQAFQAANMPETDAVTVGGAIATAGIVEFTDIAATDTIQVLSDGADTRNITITGRLASGAIDSETLTLNGATPVNGAKSYERILKVVLASSSGTRTVTVRRTTGATTIATLGLNITSARRLFYDAASQVGSTTRYEKFFYKNTNGTLTLNNAALKLTADPAATIRIGGAPSVDDSATATNRVTAPASVTFVDDNISQSVAGGVIAAASAIGVWVEMVRGAAAAAIKNTFSVELSGTST